MSSKPLAPNTTIAVKTGTKYEPFDLDISRWHGRIIGQAENGDYLVRWDKPTIETIPGWVVASWIETGEDWSCMELEAQMLRAVRARDQIDDWFDALCRRLHEQGITPNFLSAPAFIGEMSAFDEEDDFFDEEDDAGIDLNAANYVLDEDELETFTGLGLTGFPLDDDDDEIFEAVTGEAFDEFEEIDLYDEEEIDWEPFDFEEFIALLQIPAPQVEPILDALSQAKDLYYEENYVDYSSPLIVEAFMETKLSSPYIFGYVLASILNNHHLSRLTKIKVCQYTLDQVDPLDREGIPYGLVNMLAFLAREGLLVMPVFGLLLFMLDYTRRGLFGSYNWLEDLSHKSELMDLLTWLLKQEEMDEEELLWWFWRFSMMCGEVHHSWGKALSALWMEGESPSVEIKKQLYRAWLEDWNGTGQAPMAWQLTEAQSAGDVDTLLELYEQAGISPTVEEITFLQEHAQEVSSVVEDSFLFRRQRWNTNYTPPYFKRLSILELARLGEPIEGIIKRYWNSDPDTEMVHQGMADVLAKFHQQLPPAQLQTLVERGLNHSSFRTRRPFFELSVQLYGDKYLNQALQDQSKSIQNWAKKQQAK